MGLKIEKLEYETQIAVTKLREIGGALLADLHTTDFDFASIGLFNATKDMQ